MPFSSLVCAGIETTINKLVSLDKNSASLLDTLDGKVVHIKLNEYKEPLYFYIASRRIDVFSNYEGDVSVTLTLGIDTLIALKNKQSISELIKQDKLIIDGDIKVLQQFSDLLTTLDIDWAEIISPYTGDVLAHRISQQAKKINGAIQTQGQSAKVHFGDYIKHEAKLTISPLEFLHFCDQIESLTTRVDQLSAAITTLEN